MKSITVSFRLTQTSDSEDELAGVVGNLLAFRLRNQVEMDLDWVVERVELPDRTHCFAVEFRLPGVLPDPTLRREARQILADLGTLSRPDLDRSYEEALSNGLEPVAVGYRRASPDYWNRRGLRQLIWMDGSDSIEPREP